MLIKPVKSDLRQTTIAREVHLYDRRGGVRLVPSYAGQGLVFSFEGQRLRACASMCRRPPEWGDGRLPHLMAAVFAAKVDNLLIEVARRLPHPDDSSESFAELLAAAGIKRFPTRRVTAKIVTSGKLARDDGAFAALGTFRGHGLLLETVNDRPPQLGLQCARFLSSSHDFREHLAWARHGHSESKKRYAPDESARHDLIHVLGSLALLPMRVEGTIRLYRPSTALISDVLEALDPAAELPVTQGAP